MPEVGVILGSKSDLPLMEACLEPLKGFGVGSAHRVPARVVARAGTAREGRVNDGEVALRHGEKRRALAGR